MSERITEMTDFEAAYQIPAPIRARLARPTVRLSGSVGYPMVASFFDQLLPVLEVEGSILIELYYRWRRRRDPPTSRRGSALTPPTTSPGYLVLGQDPCRLGGRDGNGGVSQEKTLANPRRCVAN